MTGSSHVRSQAREAMEMVLESVEDVQRTAEEQMQRKIEFVKRQRDVEQRSLEQEVRLALFRMHLVSQQCH